MKIRLVFILVFFSLSSYSQDFVVTTKGDTLRGKVKILVNGLDKRIQITDGNKKKTTLTIIQVKNFSFSGENYQTVRTASSYEFMKLMKEGYLSLFAFQVEKQLTYDGRYLLKKDGAGIEVPNLTFKKSMLKFLENCPSLTTEIENSTLGRRDLDLIIDRYNECIGKYSDELKKTASLTTLTPTNNVSTAIWDNLYKETEASSIESKADILDMINDVKGKVSRSERVPKFLIDGLKSSLSSSEALTKSLTTALETISQ